LLSPSPRTCCNVLDNCSAVGILLLLVGADVDADDELVSSKVPQPPLSNHPSKASIAYGSILKAVRYTSDAR